MIRIILIIAISFLIVSCNGQVKKRNEDANQLSRIEQLKQAYENKDYSSFLKLFPKNYNEFQEFYGYNENMGEVPLYSISLEHVTFLFTNPKGHLLPLIKKVVRIGIKGKWDADAVNYFQHGLKILIINYPKEVFEILDTITDNEAESFWYFVVDGPHPDNKENNELISILSRQFGDNNKQIILLKEQFNKAKFNQTH